MSGKNIVDLTGAAFDGQVAQGVTIVDFWAPWCGPCRMMTPILETVAAQVEGKAVVAKVTVDEEPDLAARFQVRGIPTIIVFKEGQVVRQMVGVQKESVRADVVNELAG